MTLGRSRTQYPRHRASTPHSSPFLPLSGLRINEALALKMGSDAESSYWSPRQSKLVIRKGLYRGQEQSPKTVAGVREVDLAPRINDYLISCLKDRPPGDFLFTNHNGGPLCLQSVYDAKKELGLPGLHSFRRFRITHLEKMDVPRGLAMFWTGHAAGDVHANYIKLGKDIKARKDWAEKAGIGFELPKEGEYMKKIKKDDKKKWLKCEGCGKSTEDVMLVEDPYDADVNDTSVLRNLCNDCYTERVDDI